MLNSHFAGILNGIHGIHSVRSRNVKCHENKNQAMLLKVSVEYYKNCRARELSKFRYELTGCILVIDMSHMRVN